MNLAQVVGCAGAIAALSFFAAEARAGADEKIAAEALFDEGKRLMVEGKFAAACNKLEESERMDAAVGTLLYLGECYEKMGRTASAWATFREASSAARAAGQLERARIGQERAARLEPGLVKLTINIAPEDVQIPGFTLKRSTESVPQALWGSPVPVDPGEYAIEASAPGYETFSRRITVGGQSVSTDVPKLVPGPAPLPSTAPPPEATPAAPASANIINTGPPAPPAADHGTGMSGGQIAGIVLAGAGAVSLVVGTVFGVNAISKNDDSKALCPNNVCTVPRGETLSKDANSDAVVANVTIGLGAAAFVGGAILYFLSPSGSSSSEMQTGVHVVPVVGAREMGAFAEGRF